MNKVFELIKKNWQDIIKPVGVLLAICIVIPLALSVTNLVTHERIAELEVKNAMATMQGLVQADEFIGEVGENSYYKAVKGGSEGGRQKRSRDR